MKKYLLLFVASILIPICFVKAQVVLNETFDTVIPEDWTIVDANNDGKTFHSPSKYGIQGQTHVACFSKCTDDYLISPRLTVTEQAHILTFQAAGNSQYAAFSMDIMVSEGTVNTTEFVPVKKLEKIKVESWESGTQQIDLSSYIGKDIYVAWHVTWNSSSYSDYGIDNVSGLTRWVDPEAHIFLKEPVFPLGTVGTPISTNMVIKNKGSKPMNLTGAEVAPPFFCELSPIVLSPGEETSIPVSFNPSTVGKFDGQIRILGDGVINGDNTMSLFAMACSEGALFEDFEGEKFPPVGWTVVKDDPSLTDKNSWTQLPSNAYQGNKSAGLMYGQIGGKFVSPKLMINAGDKMYFFMKFRSVPQFKVQYSKDGVRWTDLLVVTDNNNELYKEYEIDLTPAAGESFVAFYCESPYCFIDNVALPGMAEAPIPPESVENPFPEMGRQKVYTSPELKWDKVAGASGYKLSVGSNAAANDILDGIDVKNVNSYIVNKLPANTTINWKVEAYNAYGISEETIIWNFTTFQPLYLTQEKGLPYTQDFESANFLPEGWCATDDCWKQIRNNGHTGDYAVWVKGERDGETILYGPKVKVPENYQLEYFWARNRNGELVNNTKSIATDTLFFEVLMDDAKTWVPFDTINTESVTRYDSVYHNLTEYAGVDMSFRWRVVSKDPLFEVSYVFDDFTLNEIPDNPELWVSIDSWYGGYQRKGAKVTSDIIEIINTKGSVLEFTIDGLQDTDYSLDIEQGESFSLVPREKMSFSITYNPSDLADDNEVLKITSNGGDVEIPLVGYAIKDGGMTGGFENVEDFSLDLAPWTTIDVDKSGTYGFGESVFPNYGKPMSFMALNPAKCTPAVKKLEPHSGDKCGACFGAEMPEYGGTGPNNDWLISPLVKVSEGMFLEFYAQSWGGWVAIEQFKVWVSTTDKEISSFTCISGESPVNAPIGEWTKFVYELDTYANQDIYVAIQCVTSWGLVFLIDDITFKVEKNSLPEFKSSPVEILSVGEQYLYNIEFADMDKTDMLSVKAERMPEWLEFKQINNSSAQLSGTPEAEGDYDVELVLSDGKSETRQVFTITVNKATGINDYVNEGQQVYPNPANAQFTIANSKGGRYSVFNILGQFICNGKINSDNHIINSSTWNAGIYYVRMEVKGKTTVRQIVIE